MGSFRLDSVDGCLACVYKTFHEAMQYSKVLQGFERPYRIKIIKHPSRLKLPMEVAVVLVPYGS